MVEMSMNSKEFNRRRDFYELKDEKKRVIRDMNASKFDLNVIDKLGILSLSDESNFGENTVRSFSSALKVHYEQQLERFVDQMFMVQNNYTHYQRRRRPGNNQYTELKKKFYLFYKVRTGGLSNLHVLFYLKMIDFRYIWANFICFINYYYDDRFDQKIEQLNSLHSRNPQSKY
jgi:hypothetical protein